MKKISLIWLFLSLPLFLFSGCATTKITRVDVNEKIDISGAWNDYDAMLVAEEMVRDSLKRSWLDEFIRIHGRDPIVIVGHIDNRSHEHIATQVITKHLEQELINSGKVIFVASGLEREEIRGERDEQQEGYTDPETIKAIGKERGADFMLKGSIDSVKDESKNQYVILYQVNLELIDLETNQKVWIGQKKIKKRVQKSKFSL